MPSPSRDSKILDGIGAVREEALEQARRISREARERAHAWERRHEASRSEASGRHRELREDTAPRGGRIR